MKSTLGLLIIALSMLTGCELITPTTTPVPQATYTAARFLPDIILTEVLQKLDRCMSDDGIVTADNSSSFFCRNSADTGYTVTMARYESEAAATVQFGANRGGSAVTCFHGYTSYLESSTNPYNKYVLQDSFGWLVGQYLVTISASYDYGYFHYNIASFSEEIYASGIEHKLFITGECP